MEQHTMRYILTIKNAQAKTTLELSYNMWSQVRECAGLLQRGVEEHYTFNIQIYDNETKRVVYNENTY